MLGLPGVTSLKKINFPSPGSHHLPITPQEWELFKFYADMLLGLILGRQPQLLWAHERRDPVQLADAAGL